MLEDHPEGGPAAPCADVRSGSWHRRRLEFGHADGGVLEVHAAGGGGTSSDPEFTIPLLGLSAEPWTDVSGQHGSGGIPCVKLEWTKFRGRSRLAMACELRCSSVLVQETVVRDIRAAVALAEEAVDGRAGTGAGAGARSASTGPDGDPTGLLDPDVAVSAVAWSSKEDSALVRCSFRGWGVCAHVPGPDVRWCWADRLPTLTAR